MYSFKVLVFTKDLKRSNKVDIGKGPDRILLYLLTRNNTLTSMKTIQTSIWHDFNFTILVKGIL